MKVRNTESYTTNDLHQALNTELRKHHKKDANVWVREIVLDENMLVFDNNEELFRVPFGIASTKPLSVTIDLSNPEKVVQSTKYVPAKEALVFPKPEPDAGRIVEAARLRTITESVTLTEASEGTGEVWDAVVIEEGTSLNRRHYDGAALDQLGAFLDRDIDVYANHATDEEVAKRSEGDVWNKIGFVRGRTREATSLNTKLYLLESVLAGRMAKAYRHGNKNFYQLSINAEGEVEKREIGGQIVEHVKTISALHSVDLVTKGAAGGRITRLAASAKPITRENIMKGIKTLDALRSHDEAMAEAILSMKKNAAVKFLKTREAEAELIAAVEAELTEAKEEPAPEPKPEPQKAKESAFINEAAKPVDVDGAVKAAVKEAFNTYSVALKGQQALTESLTGDLPEPVKDALRRQFKESTPTVEDVTSAKETFISLFMAANPAAVNTTGQIVVGDDARDKASKGVYGALIGESVDGIAPFHSIKQAYRAVTGKHEDDPRRIVAAAYNYVPEDERSSLQESLTTSTFAQVLGDNLHRAMMKQFAEDDLMDWKAIVSSESSWSDFETHRIGRVGGYGNLSTVAESGTYQSLTSPGDEEATGSLAKKGGLEDFTMEMAARDDMGVIAAIGRRLVWSAKNTQRTDVWNTLANNDTCTYDSVALGHANHGNLGSTALSVSTLETGVNAMRTQTAYGWSTRTLGRTVMPKFLIVPNELRRLGYQLVYSDREPRTTDYNINVFNVDGNGLGLIVVDDWTDADNWFLVANPKTCPTIDVAYFRGKKVPELFVADDPKTGSMLTADKITYKIRFIYGVTILDHRSFYLAVV